VQFDVVPPETDLSARIESHDDIGQLHLKFVFALHARTRVRALSASVQETCPLHCSFCDVYGLLPKPEVLNTKIKYYKITTLRHIFYLNIFYLQKTALLTAALQHLFWVSPEKKFPAKTQRRKESLHRRFETTRLLKYGVACKNPIVHTENIRISHKLSLLAAPSAFDLS